MPRLTQLPFPSYTYVPGKTPHPVRDPDGHSFGANEPHVDEFDADRWQECEAFLFGIDLFNGGFYWESHEQWEAVWHAVGRKGAVADFLKGLIKLSAAGVKMLEQREVGVQRHAARAVELFELVGRSHKTLCGYCIVQLQEEANALLSRADSISGNEEIGIQL